MKKDTLIKGGLVAVAAFIIMNVGAIISLKSSMSELNREVKVDTVRVTDTVRITDTIEVEVIKKVYVKRKSSRKVDYIYLYSQKYDVMESFRLSRQYADEGKFTLSRAYLKKGKDIIKETNEYKSHIIYVD